MRSPRTATKSSPCSPQPEKARGQQQRPDAAKNNKYINKFFLKRWHLLVEWCFSARLELEGTELAGSAAVERTQWK